LTDEFDESLLPIAASDPLILVAVEDLDGDGSGDEDGDP
jgi:hypothetical protein